MKTKGKATLYLLHFDRPYWGNCQHYVGYTTLPIEERLACHRNGSGAKLARYAKEHGIDFVLAWSKEFETKQEAMRAETEAKRKGHLKGLCPICKEMKE